MSADTQPTDNGEARKDSPLPSKSKKTAETSKPKAGKTKAAKSFALVKPSNQKARLIANHAKLDKLAGEIRGSQEFIGVLSKTAREKMEDTMVEVARCGKLLSECKALVAHGEWLRWLKDNCKMSVATAQHYMRVATLELSNKERALYLEEPKSIRQAIALLAAGRKAAAPKKGKAQAKGEADDVEIQRIARPAKRLVDALESLPREKRNSAFDALTAIRDWVNSASIPV